MANQTLMFRSHSQPAALLIAAGLSMLLLLGSPEPRTAQAQDGSQKTSAARSDYRLGSFDQLRLRIVTWRPSQAEVFEWNAINGEYTIDASGKISLPLIGEIQAADTTTGELADLIAEHLQQRTNIAQRPTASIEIIKFKPFYIVGDVANSGSIRTAQG